MQKTVLFSLSLTISTLRLHQGVGFSQHSLAMLLTFVDKHGKDNPTLSKIFLSRDTTVLRSK